MHTALVRAEAFAAAYGLRLPILMAPMAGACPAALAIAVSTAGGMGACGALMMQPDAIRDWGRAARSGGNGAFQMNLWIPDPPPVRDAVAEARVRAFLGQWGPPVPPEAADVTPIDFSSQCEALLDVGPTVVSSIMGRYPPEFVAALKTRGIRWWATVTTVTEARQAEAAGADAVVAQGAESGGHRGAFQPEHAERAAVGLFALLPAVVDAVRVPVIATGGIGDGRGVAAALLLGASAVQVGTALLRSPEAAITPSWADAIGRARPEDTIVSRSFSGRAGRSIATAYARASLAADAPPPAPYPVQRALTQAMRDQGARENDVNQIQAWAGQAAGLARAMPAGEIVTGLWTSARAILSGGAA